MNRPRGRPLASSAGEARAQILAAAAEAFALTGYEGTDIEAVARAAGCNRSLIYHHFKDKAGLFRAVLDQGTTMRSGDMAGQPPSLAEGIKYWFGQNLADPQRLRLVMQEALAEDAAGPIPAGRADYLGRQLEVVREFQARGLLRADMDPRHLLTAILALTSFPACFPKVAMVSLGVEDSGAMKEEWLDALDKIARLLGGDMPTR